MEPVNYEADQICIIVDPRNEADCEDRTHKQNVAGAHAKQGPSHLDIAALQLSSSFLNSEIGFS